MNRTRPHCRAGWESRAVVCRWARVGTEALVVAALWLFAASCLAVEPSAATPSSEFAPAPLRFSAGEAQQNHRFDLVVVQPEGWSRQGFRYQISLLSSARGFESALDLNTGEGGLLVTARDVDGIGNDLDLIIKDAKSYTPLGLWINDHHGGFIKVDSRLYAPSLWAEGPAMAAAHPLDTIQRVLLAQSQPCIYPLLPLGARRVRSRPGLIDAWNFRFAASPHRGPA